MQTFNLTVGQVKNVTATPKDSSGFPASCSGFAVLTNTDDTVARRTNNDQAGLIDEITAVAPGSTVFTLTGHQSDGITPFATSFQVNVAAGEPTHFDFAAS